MKKIILLFTYLILLFSNKTFSQSRDENAVRKILSEQTAAWNSGNIENFMRGYWQNDSLMFVGKSGITYGWQKTLQNYKKNYPDAAAMGKLDFTLLHVNRLSDKYYFVIGKWHLARTIGDIGGHFTLLFQKINDNWVIITDHTS